uniref:Uncharacterized protein n=1 Tax=Caenorhabditis japonica TaxID=281687 RepID=A0A8R1EDZ9_CAEJA
MVTCQELRLLWTSGIQSQSTLPNAAVSATRQFEFRNNPQHIFEQAANKHLTLIRRRKEWFSKILVHFSLIFFFILFLLRFPPHYFYWPHTFF